MSGCTIQTGDYVGAAWKGPLWTPFAEAIAAEYNTHLPWFFNAAVDLGVPPQRLNRLTPPYEHDVIIFGAHIAGNAAQLPFVFVNITHRESGVPWAAPTVLPFIPLTALGGINVNNMPNLKFPEVFFLPARTQLQLDFVTMDPAVGDVDPLVVTLIGVQLVSPKRGRAPDKVTMPNGQRVRTDERLPLFMTMGLGKRTPSAAYARFDMAAGDVQVLQYLPPLNCDAEIHDLCANVISPAFDFINVAQGTSFLRFKLTVMGAENQWTPNLSPLITTFGGPGGGTGGATLVYPALPYTKPYLLPRGRRIQILQQNTNSLLAFTNGNLTFRGVRLCEY